MITHGSRTITGQELQGRYDDGKDTLYEETDRNLKVVNEETLTIRKLANAKYRHRKLEPFKLTLCCGREHIRKRSEKEELFHFHEYAS